MDRSYAVFGLGEFGRSVSYELMEIGSRCVGSRQE